MKPKRIIYGIFIGLCASLFIISFVCSVFRGKNEFIRDISSYNLNDTISDIYYNKDDFGPGTVTKFFRKDSLRFCFYGINDSLKLFYPTFAKEEDIIIKRKDSDSFYLRRNDSLYGFKIKIYW